MKCKSCNVQVSPTFVAAISDNKCPACGKRMMTEVHYKKIFHVAEQIGGLGFDEKIIVGLAAAIASKFTLVPKDLALEQDENGNIELESDDEPVYKKKAPSAKNAPPPKGMSSQAARKINMLNNLEQDDDEDDDLTPEEEQALVKEWGLEAGSKDNVVVGGSSSYDHDLASSLEGMDFGGDMPVGPVVTMGGNSAAAKHAELLARAAQVKNNPNNFRVRRVDE